MAVERKFVQQGLNKARLGEYFAEQLDRAGYAGMQINRTPMGTQVTVFVEKPGMVIGKGGKSVRKLTKDLDQFYNLDNPQIDVQNVNTPELNAQLMASRLASALERGWYFRKAAHSTLRRIREAGAIGCRITLSGKLTGPRSRIEKIVEGYIVHAGKPAEQIVHRGFATAVRKLGTIGCSIQIVLPDAVLPDVFRLVDVEPPEPTVEEKTAEEEKEMETAAGMPPGETEHVEMVGEGEIAAEEPGEKIEHVETIGEDVEITAEVPTEKIEHTETIGKDVEITAEGPTEVTEVTEDVGAVEEEAVSTAKKAVREEAKITADAPSKKRGKISKKVKHDKIVGEETERGKAVEEGAPSADDMVAGTPKAGTPKPSPGEEVVTPSAVRVEDAGEAPSVHAVTAQSPVETKGIPTEAVMEVPPTMELVEQPSPVETEGLSAGGGEAETRNVNGVWKHRHDDLDWHVMTIRHKTRQNQPKQQRRNK